MNKLIIIMGVSGCGKTTVGEALSKALALPFYDADDYHPKANIEKMRSGTSLTDIDRRPWLEILAKNLVTWKSDGGAILACSALKEDYRNQLQQYEKVNWVYLAGDFKTIHHRMKHRAHFMKANMLQSQFDTLEPPNYGIQLQVSLPVREMVHKIKDILSYA